MCLVVLVAASAVVALAASVDGKWISEMPGRGGDTTEVTFTFKAEGATLTGSMSNPMGETPISEGKISGNDISFVVAMTRGDREMKTSYKGTVSGDEIKLTSERPGRDGGDPRIQEFTAKRAGN